MNALLVLRPAGRDDVTGIEKLTADDSCVRWDGLTRLTAELLASRWRTRQFLQCLIQIAESKGALRGYSDVYQVSQKLIRLHGVANDVETVSSLIDWTRNETQSQVRTFRLVFPPLKKAEPYSR